MKKLVSFALSFAAAFFVFIIVALAVLLFSGNINIMFDGIFGGSEDRRQTENQSLQNAEEVLVKSAELILMLETDQKLYVSTVSLSKLGDETSILVTGVFDDESAEDLYKQLVAKGIYVFTDDMNRALGIGKAGFIKFDEESFAKTADRLNGVVYNKKDKQLLLTGLQAVETVDAYNFPEFCEQLLKKAASKNLEQEFLSLANKTVNSLSYPVFYEFALTNG